MKYLNIRIGPLGQNSPLANKIMFKYHFTDCGRVKNTV